MPVWEKVCISSYLGIFRLTAVAATAATSQELSISGKAPGPSRAGSKYPVRESLTSIFFGCSLPCPGRAGPLQSLVFASPSFVSSQSNVEVRDSRTGYLIPARDGPGALPDMDSSWDAVAAAAVALAAPRTPPPAPAAPAGVGGRGATVARLRRRRRRRPENSPHLVMPLGHHVQEANIPFGNPSLRLSCCHSCTRTMMCMARIQVP